MANITLSEAEYLRDLGTIVLGTLERVVEYYDESDTETFTGREVADFLYGKAVNLQVKYQARINELEADNE